MDKYIEQVGRLILDDGDETCFVSSDIKSKEGEIRFEITNPKTQARYEVAIKQREL